MMSTSNLPSTVYLILQEHSLGISEYELLEKLSNLKIYPFENLLGHTSYDLFTAHFVLFHCLYLLKQKLLLNKKAILQISCLKIQLLDYKENIHTLQINDLLEQYYLDFDQLLQTSSGDVEKMISDFWKQYSNPSKRDKALEILNLSKNATKEEINKRFRFLAKKTHPDLGGQASDFKKISEAREILL